MDLKRPLIWKGWMDYRRELAKIGLRFSMWVDGSFTTAKFGPSDIDFAVMVDGTKADRLKGKASDNFDQLFDEAYTKPKFLCHAQLVPVYPYGHKQFDDFTAFGLSYWTRVFGGDKQSNSPKAILLVKGSGVI